MVEVASLGAEADQNIQKQAGKTLLHEAAEHNDTKDIKFLLEMGFDSNVQDQSGKTPLHYAAENNYLQVIELLLKAGADPNMQDQSEKTPSEYATENECRQAIENKRNLTTPDSSVGERNDYSNSSGDDSKAKPAELSDCNTEEDQDHDSDDSRKNEESEVNNSSEKLLLEKGADLNAQDQSGETLFEYATEDEYKGSSHSSDDPHENQENATDERHVSGGNDPTDKGNLTNDFSNDPNKHDEDSSCSSSNYLFLEDSLLAKLKIPLTTDEQKLTDKFCEEISGINKKEPKESILESIEKIVNNYLNKGIRLNSNYNDKGDKKTVTNLIFEEIKDVLDDRMKPRNGTKEYIGNDKASDIISDLLLAGGKAKEFFRNNLAQRYSSNDFNDLDKKYKEIKSKLKGIAYESIVKKSTQTQDGLEVGIDNGHFCIEYPQDSIIEPVKILNNEKAKELKLKVCTLKIVESIVRVERVNGKRNYTDILGSIKMSFTTEAGEISIYLHPSEKDSNKIEVEIDKESEARLNKLKAEKKSLGENCLLGGKSVLEAIEDKGFKKNGSVFTESTETTKVIHLLILRKLICGVRKKIPLGGISHSVKILRN